MNVGRKKPAFAAVLASHASSKTLQLMGRHRSMKWHWRATGMNSMNGMLHVIPVSPATLPFSDLQPTPEVQQGEIRLHHPVRNAFIG